MFHVYMLHNFNVTDKVGPCTFLQLINFINIDEGTG